MARVTIKELQLQIEQLKQELERADYIINSQAKKIEVLQEEKREILNSKNSVELTEHEAFMKQFQDLQDNYKEMKALYEHEKKRNSILINMCARLEKEIAESRPKHNERGAGRKSTLTDEQLNRIRELHQQGFSYGAIAKEVGFSKAYIHKIINRQANYE